MDELAASARRAALEVAGAALAVQAARGVVAVGSDEGRSLTVAAGRLEASAGAMASVLYQLEAVAARFA
jgi:hypothetical protein